MSAYHHKAVLISSELPTLEYRFYSNSLDVKSATGVFRVSLETWKFEITEAATEVPEVDRVVVNALVHKLKKQTAESDTQHQLIEVIEFVA